MMEDSPWSNGPKNLALVLASSLLVLPGCDKAPSESNASQNNAEVSSPSQTLNENIGWIHGTCIAIRNGNIKPGTPVKTIRLSTPQQIVSTKIIGVADSDETCPALLSDRAEINKQDGRFFYRLDTGKDSLDTMAVGLISAKVTGSNPSLEFDLNDDGVVEHAGTCVSGEGIQFYISSSKTFDDTALWSDYYYLGYDNKPTCP